MTPGSATAIPVTSPWDGAVIGGVDAADEAAVGRAVAAGRAAFAGWGATPVKDRVQVLFRFKALVERDLAVLAELVSRENGKTPAAAREFAAQLFLAADEADNVNVGRES